MVDRNFKDILDNWLLMVSDLLGLRVSRAATADFSQCLLHPSEAYYASNGRPVVFGVPLSRMRGMGSCAYPCSKSSFHPYVLSLLSHHTKDSDGYAGSALELFYKAFTPSNVSEYLGFNPKKGDNCAYLSPYKAVLPWEAVTPDQRELSVVQSVYKDQRSRRPRAKLQLNDWHLFGPMSQEAGVSAWLRLVEVYESIKRKGYQRSSRIDGDIRGQVLLDDRALETWCFWVWGGGQHRAGALGALGIEFAPVTFLQNRVAIIRRSEAEFWPQVIGGQFTLESAVSVFDRIIEGRQPPLCSLREQ